MPCDCELRGTPGCSGRGFCLTSGVGERAGDAESPKDNSDSDGVGAGEAEDDEVGVDEEVGSRTGDFEAVEERPECTDPGLCFLVR